MHNFYVPVTRRNVAQARVEMETVEEKAGRQNSAANKRRKVGDNGATKAEMKQKEGTRVDAQIKAEKPKKDAERKGYQHQGSTIDRVIHPENRFRVFGMTARILVDAARVAYGEEPEFESNQHIGDEELIARLLRDGYLVGKKREGEESVRRFARF